MFRVYPPHAQTDTHTYIYIYIYIYVYIYIVNKYLLKNLRPRRRLGGWEHLSQDFQGQKKYIVKCAIYTHPILSVGGEGGWLIGWPTFADQECRPTSARDLFWERRLWTSAIILRDDNTAFYYRITLWDNIKELYYGTILRDNITELYYGIISRDNITESYYRIIVQNNITELYYGII